MSESVLPMFSSRAYIIFGLTFRSLIHFEFIFVYGVRKCSQFSSVAQSCPTLCDPMNRSMPRLPVHHQLPEYAEIHVHRVSDAIQPSHLLSSKEDKNMDKKHMIRCSTLLITREMQIKTTMRYQLTAGRMAIIK